MIERGEIDAKRGKRMAELFAKLERHYARAMSPEAAAAEASERTLQALEGEAALKRRRTLMQVQAQQRALADLKSYKGNNAYRGIQGLLDDGGFGNLDASHYDNIARSTQRLEFQAHADLEGFIERHRRGFNGKARDKAGAEDVVRELHGESTGNARAKVFADAVRDTFESLRQRFNAAGGNIGKLEDYGLPHRHDALKVRRAGFDQWLADIEPKLDMDRMVDAQSGAPITGEDLPDVLKSVFETIRTNGLTGDASSAFRGNGAGIANRGSEHRFLHFKSADDWLTYDAKYGTGDPFAVIMGHVRGMSEDIATLERLGPTPDATLRLLLDTVDHSEAQSMKDVVGSVVGISADRDTIEHMWKYMKGEFSTPVVQEGMWQRPSYYVAQGLGGMRSLLTSTMLGSAPLSAISDLNTQRMVRGFTGVPRFKALTSMLLQLNPASAAHRKLAIRLGLGMRDASHAMLGAHRYFSESNAAGWTSVVADDVLRVSGLNKMTEAGQRGYGIDLLGELGDHRSGAFDALTPELQRTLQSYGLDAEAWDVIRKAEPERMGGAEWVNARNIPDQRISDRVQDMVLGYTSRAVQESSISSRALLTWGRPGSLTGEVGRTMTQFRGFSVALLMTQAPIMARLGLYRGALYGANFFVGMTLSGALAIQLRQIAQGKDPRPMDSAEFWEDAAVQGGGVGIYGDLIGSFVSDRIGSVAGFVGGPLVSFADDLHQAVNTARPKKGADGNMRDGNPGGAVTRMVKRYTPGGNLWYARLAYERLIIDSLGQEIDPHYDLSRARIAAANAQNHQGTWWAPGETAPGRAPDLENALGNQGSPQ